MPLLFSGKYSSSLKKSDKEYQNWRVDLNPTSVPELWTEILFGRHSFECATSWELKISEWIFLLSGISRCKKFWRWRLSSIPHRPGDRPLYYPRPTQHYTMCVGHTLQCWPRHARWRLEHQKWSLSPCDHWDVKVSIKNLLRQGNDTFKRSLSKIQLLNDVFKFRGVACLNVSTLLLIFCDTRFCVGPRYISGGNIWRFPNVSLHASSAHFELDILIQFSHFKVTHIQRDTASKIGVQQGPKLTLFKKWSFLVF